MKFRVFCAIALCICFEQLCSASNASIEKDIKKIKDDLQNKIHGVGEQFVEDVTTIIDHTPSNPCFIDLLKDGLVYALGRITKDQNNTKFSVSGGGYFYFLNVDQPKPDYQESLQLLDNYKILQSILAKQFPPERYNGIINMFYIDNYPNATSEEIANTLHYLDGTDDAARKISYIDLNNIPQPVASDCPYAPRLHSEALDKLKSMIDIKPKVFEDFASIREKFPCNLLATDGPQILVHMLTEFHGDKHKIDACEILKENLGKDVKSDDFEYKSMMRESFLSVRLPEETFRGLFNVIRAYYLRMPKDEIEEALEYLYDDVSKADCSSYRAKPKREFDY